MARSNEAGRTIRRMGSDIRQAPGSTADGVRGSISHYIKDIGRGKDGARAITREQAADLFGQLTPSAASTWQTLEHVRRWWPGRLLVKGLLHPEDARQAVALGADGIIVSNHGARQLDAAPSPLAMLPAIRAAVPDTVLGIDSGIRRGSDIVTALCLGAQFALCGRPMMHAVTVGGADGVQRALHILHSETDRVLAQLGCRHLDELGTDHLRPAGIMHASPQSTLS